MSINLETVPTHVAIINAMSSTLFHNPVGQISLAGVVGSGLGVTRGKPASYTVYSALTYLFWKYIQPCTIKPIFMHKKSNVAAQTVGLILSCVVSTAIPFVFNKYILSYAKKLDNTPGLLRKEQEKSPINPLDVLLISTTPLITDYLIGSTLYG